MFLYLKGIETTRTKVEFGSKIVNKKKILKIELVCWIDTVLNKQMITDSLNWLIIFQRLNGH